MRAIAFLTAVAVLALAPGVSEAKKRKRSRKKKTVQVPVGFEIGPAAYWITGPVADDQTLHYGAVIDVYAVIDKKTIQENKDRVPKKYRSLVANLEEIRLRPLSLFLPRSLFISPKINNTGMFGASLRPIGLGLSLTRKPIRISVGVGLLVTYAFIYSDVLPTPTHFIRPGLDPTLDIEIPVTDSFLVSVGWASQFYIPQKLGEFGFGDLDQSIWHIGQAYLALHFRFPWEQTL